ncbi:MAG: phosphoenolpyruvate carboxylase, partial [Gammaproteobacteria bacterium]|nr:phosphoenolpyruvate carboxylase [Gammaproteobacteria bacterium]
MNPRSVTFPATDTPLRADVNTLGAIVGEVLVEQYGQALFDQVEALRVAAIGRREASSADLANIAESIHNADLQQARMLVRGFSGYFQVVNLAEKVHRIRRIRDYQRAGETLSGSLQQKLSELRDAGATAATIERLLATLVIEPVMTAHPTEATRRTLLAKERIIVRQLVARFDADRTPQEEQTALDRIRQEITAGWQTRSFATAKTTVAAEREHVLFYISDILYEVVPVFYEALRAALDATFPGAFADQPLPRILSFGSWVGGDMDGNPNVDHRTLAASLVEHRRLIVERYVTETRALAQSLSQSLGEVGVAAAVTEQVARYTAQMPDTAAAIPAGSADMPYRALLTFSAARLQHILRPDNDAAAHAYTSCEEFLADMQLIRASLAEHRGTNAGLFQVDRLIWRIRTFGFHLAALDVRQDSAELRAAVANLLGDDDWHSRSVAERTTRLTAALQHPPAPPAEPGPPLERALAVLSTINASRHTYGPQAIGAFIISMAQGADDVLAVLLLARVSGLTDAAGHAPLDVQPLLETVPDLEAGPGILRQLAALAPYRGHLEQRGNRQLIMIGYSDSCKDGGIASARWALQQAQQQMSTTATELGLKLGFFHGRGGTVSRGGGNMVHGIYAAPANSVNGYLRVTEQGEVIHQKYGIRAIALRNLEQITGATLAATLRSPPADVDNWLNVMTTIAAASKARYRELVYGTPEFVRYFRQATPIDVIERLAIGSRPSARRSKDGIENLRAIPWVFSWAQIRVGLPGTFGAGTGLAAAIEQHGLVAVRAMLQWPFFSGLLNDIEMVLAKSDLDIGQRYSLLAEPGLRFIHDDIAAELRLAETLILDIKQTDQLLTEDPTLQRAIRLRNPYVDPLNLLQIKLLRDWRAT